jgi:hypothetical protein
MRPEAAAGVGAGAAAAFGASATGAMGASAVEPSDLSEPSGLAPVSIKQTTATATASPLPLSM